MIPVKYQLTIYHYDWLSQEYDAQLLHIRTCLKNAYVSIEVLENILTVITDQVPFSTNITQEKYTTCVKYHNII